MMRHSLPFILACCLAAVIPLWSPRATSVPDTADFPGWPATFEGRALMPLPLSARELRFAEGFPGQLGRFHDGKRELVIRWVTRETRKLHSAADCFQGLGYHITPQSLLHDEQGALWQSFIAEHDGERLRIRERIYEAKGEKGWPDVSAWYWQALLGKTAGAWWAVTIAERC